jgi:hypothetical protein
MDSCPGRGGAFFTLLRRAGTRMKTPLWAPDQQRTATALRSIRGTAPNKKGGPAAAPL